MSEVYADLGARPTDFMPGGFSDTQLFNMLSTDLKEGSPVTLNTECAPDLVSTHAYTLICVTKVNGINEYAVRNPWGVSGSNLENSQGIATLTYAQLVANFAFGAAG